MKQINSNTLLQNLQDDVRQIIFSANQLHKYPQELLMKQPEPNAWCVAQVLEHLNKYSRYYMEAIEKQLHRNQTTASNSFVPGWLGNYFTNLMKPTKENTIAKKMKAPKNAIPSLQPNANDMLSECISHQHHLLNLLTIAKSVDLNTNRIPTSLSKVIKLKLGDTFRFFVAHEQRHFLQIDKVLKSIKQQVKYQSAVEY
jgi:DinB superfamily